MQSCWVSRKADLYVQYRSNTLLQTAFTFVSQTLVTSNVLFHLLWLTFLGFILNSIANRFESLHAILLRLAGDTMRYGRPSLILIHRRRKLRESIL